MNRLRLLGALIALVSQSLLLMGMQNQNALGDFPGYRNPGLRYMGPSLRTPGVVQRSQIMPEPEPRWKIGAQRLNVVRRARLNEFVNQVASSKSWDAVAIDLLREIRSVNAAIKGLENTNQSESTSQGDADEMIYFLRRDAAFGLAGLRTMFEFLNEAKSITSINALPNAQSQKLYQHIAQALGVSIEDFEIQGIEENQLEAEDSLV
jgi:hypothetical protein